MRQSVLPIRTPRDKGSISSLVTAWTPATLTPLHEKRGPPDDPNTLIGTLTGTPFMGQSDVWEAEQGSVAVAPSAVPSAVALSRGIAASEPLASSGPNS